MDNIINFLPPWVETNIQPAFYDKESGTCLQQTARMYAKVNQLIRHFNDLSKETRETVAEFIAKFVELKDFVDTYFENLDVQEEINNKLDQMLEDGDFAELFDEWLPKKLSYYEIDTDTTLADIKAIFAKPEAKVISFKTGNYTISEDITINANTDVLLNKSVLTFSGENLVHGFNNYTPTDEYLEYEGNSNIKIVGGTIVGGAISFCHATNIEFNGIKFVDCNNQHILEMMAIKGLKVIDCSFRGQEASVGNEYREMIQIDDCSYDNFPWFTDPDNPTYDGTPNKEWLIDKCYFGNSDTEGKVFYTAIGGHTYIENSYHDGIVISNCYFNGYSFAGVRLRNVINSKVIGNKFKAGTSESTIDTIRGERIINNILIEDNLIIGGDSQQTRGINFNTDVAEMKILNNTFKGFIDQGTPDNDDVIILFGVCPASLKIEGNTFDGNTTRIFFVHEGTTYTGTIVFNNNTLLGGTLAGYPFRFYRGKIIFTNNFLQFTYTSGQVVRLHANTEDFEFKGNKFPNAISQYIVSLNSYAGSFANIEDIYFKELDGNYASLSTTTLTEKLNEFNTLLCVFGSGSDTQVMKVTPFNPRGKLSSRTYKYTIVDSTNTSGVASITIDVTNNTLEFSKSASNVNLRTVYLANETR